MSARLLYLPLYVLLLALPLCFGSHENGQGDVRNPIIYEKIVGGKKAPPGRFPYMCSLRRRGSREHVCGASLIRRDWVLTAAHCVDSRMEEATGLSPVVHCGIYKLDETAPEKVFDVVEGYIHEDWKGNVADGNDIAVLKLNKKAKGLTLPRLGTGDVDVTAGELLAATGWGMTESTAVAKKLRVTDRLAIVKQQYCKMPPNVTDSNSWICAGGLGEDTCKGDSGGPLLLADSPKRYIEKGDPSLDMVVGITSYGYGDDEHGQCSEYEPAIYTNVDYFHNWIIKTIKLRSKHRSKAERREVARRRKEYTLLSHNDMLAKMKSAIQEDDAIDARALLLAGLDVDSTFAENVTVEGYPIQAGSILLHWAAAYDALECTKVLVEMDARTEIASDFGRTPLHMTAALGYVGIVEVLLKAGANVDAQDNRGSTPLHYAASGGYADVAEVLLKAGANVDAEGYQGWTPLFEAGGEGHADVVEVLLQAGANVDARCYNGYTPLFKAAVEGHADVVEVLLKAGADIEARENHFGWTPLHHAAAGGYVDAVEVLLEYKATVDVADKGGSTPLCRASCLGNVDAAKMLLDHGASKTVKDEKGRTPLEVVCIHPASSCSRETRATLEDLLKP